MGTILQERIKKGYDSLMLLDDFQEQDRGYKACCCIVSVLAGNGLETWKNDPTSAWIKLTNPLDSFSIVLKKQVGNDFVPVQNYVLDIEPVVNEPNAFYATVQWLGVLATEGVGCYQIIVSRTSGGVTQEIVWRNSTFNLEEYTIKNALQTARIRAIWNLDHKIDGINFSGSFVEDSIRFNGQIRKDQPNTKFRTVTQQNRRIEPIIAEKQQTWIIETDGYTDPMLKLLENLFLISPADMWISDYNRHTNSYEILDVPVSFLEDESPERIPDDDPLVRQEVLRCTVGNRVRNEKTIY